MVEIIEHLKPIGIVIGIIVGLIAIIHVIVKATTTYNNLVQQIERVETKLDTFISQFNSGMAQMEERIKISKAQIPKSKIALNMNAKG